MRPMRPRNGGKGDVEDLLWRFFCDQAGEQEFEAAGHFWLWMSVECGILGFTPDNAQPVDLWRRFRDDVLAQWIVHHPGTRPKSWWRYDAPPPGIRARVGGVGTASHEYWGRQPDGWLGIPIGWMTAEDLRRHPNADRPCTPMNPFDPPTFESQATYLDRLGLLMPGERERLGKADFRPEPLPASAI